MSDELPRLQGLSQGPPGWAKLCCRQFPDEQVVRGTVVTALHLNAL